MCDFSLNCVIFQILNLNLDQEYNIFYRQTSKWIALGTFEQAMKDDDECEWGMSDGTAGLHLLLRFSKNLSNSNRHKIGA